MNSKYKTIGTMFLTIALFSGLISAASLPSALATSMWVPDVECFGVLNCFDKFNTSPGPPGESCSTTGTLDVWQTNSDQLYPNRDVINTDNDQHPAVVCVPDSEISSTN